MFKKIQILIPIVLALFFVSTAFAADNAAIILNKKLDSFHSLKADFKQTIVGHDGKILRQSNGNLTVLRPGKFKWTVLTPLNQEIITNGKTLWIYEPDLEQVTVRQLSKDLTQTPLSLLTQQHIALQKTFNVTQQHIETFTLMPKERKESFKKMQLTFKQDLLASLVLWSSTNQKITIQFTHMQKNVYVKAEQFSFRIPKGMEVIDMTKF